VRPPAEERAGSDDVGLAGEGDASLDDDTMRLVAPAPTDLAKSARMASNSGLQMALAMFHTVRPVAGSTKPVT